MAEKKWGKKLFKIHWPQIVQILTCSLCRSQKNENHFCVCFVHRCNGYFKNYYKTIKQINSLNARLNTRCTNSFGKQFNKSICEACAMVNNIPWESILRLSRNRISTHMSVPLGIVGKLKLAFSLL